MAIASCEIDFVFLRSVPPAVTLIPAGGHLRYLLALIASIRRLVGSAWHNALADTSYNPGSGRHSRFVSRPRG
jgi:hypothetical protein